LGVSPLRSLASLEGEIVSYIVAWATGSLLGSLVGTV
jgi:hypothetical protein